MVTLKIRSRSQKNLLNSFHPTNNVSMQVCKNPSTGSEDNTRKQRYTDVGADADGICIKTNMSNPHLVGGILFDHKFNNTFPINM